MSSFSTKITLYDISTDLAEGRSVSPFTCRVRYILNYRQLPYRTEWIKFSDVTRVCKENGFDPTVGQDGGPRNTFPVIVDETSGKRVAVSDSLKIIEYLEATYPDPTRPILPAVPAGGKPALAVHLLADAYFKTVVFKFFPLVIPGLHAAIDADGQERWRNTLLGGKTIEEVTLKKGSQEYKQAVSEMQDAFKGVAACFDGSTKWVMGDQPTFVDFSILSYLTIVQLASPETWKEIVAIDEGRWEKFVEAGKEYIA